jgi:enoyl-CoA hydratase/carnithine racemase
MDLVFASPDALFLAGLVEYFSVPWDLHPRKAMERVFESRFITAEEAREIGFVNRIYPSADLRREAYRRRRPGPAGPAAGAPGALGGDTPPDESTSRRAVHCSCGYRQA